MCELYDHIFQYSYYQLITIIGIWNQELDNME